MLEKQELYCHNCGKYVQFDIDVEMNGNHVILCPECGHEHCRVVENGIITSDRWDSRNPTMFATGTTATINSTFTSYSSVTSLNTSGTQGNVTAAFLYSSWMNTTTGNSYQIINSYQTSNTVI